MHLSSEGIFRSIAGDGTPADREHMQICAECREEVRKLENALSSYGGFARDWGGGQVPVAPSLSHLLRETRRPAHIARWTGLAAAVAVGILVLVTPRVDKDRKAEPLGADPVQDVLLLEQVNAQLSRTAPMAMEPLLILLEDKDPTKEKIGEER